jgi:hypothetical protein
MEGKKMPSNFFEHQESYCDLAEHCQAHPSGEGCVMRHFPACIKTCPDYLKIKQLLDTCPEEITAG